MANKKTKIWFESKLKPQLFTTKWKDLKDKIIERYADKHETDRHLEKLRKNSYEPGSSLMGFLEDFQYSFIKAFGKKGNSNEFDEELFIRLFKNAMPDSVKSKLITLPGYEEAKSTEELEKIVQKFDLQIKLEAKVNQPQNIQISDLNTAIRGMMKSFQDEIETNRQEITALATKFENLLD